VRNDEREFIMTFVAQELPTFSKVHPAKSTRFR